MISLHCKCFLTFFCFPIFSYFFFSSYILSFPHKCGVRYNNVPADVHAHYAEPLISISLQQLIPNHLGNAFRHARKLQTIREMTFAERGNAKPFGKRLSPSAEMPNHSGNDFRHARKLQTIREMTFAKRGNAKPFGKRLSPSAEMPNLSGNNFRHARKLQTFRETTFAMRGNAKPFKK